MGCYLIPTVAAIALYFFRRQNPRLKFSLDHMWLNILLAGGAIFGLVDHIWNRELLSFSWGDLALGAFITLTLFAVWGIATTSISELPSLRND